MAERVRVEILMHEHLIPPVMRQLLRAVEKQIAETDYWRTRAAEAESHLSSLKYSLNIP